jgi:hypothetical protein
MEINRRGELGKERRADKKKPHTDAFSAGLKYRK